MPIRKVKVTENAFASTVIVEARPHGRGATPHYALAGDDAALFSITSDGVVTLNASADYEARASYQFDIVVTVGSRTSTQTVLVTVVNVNDVAPVFVSGASGSVAENAPVATPVYQAQASDPDGLAQKLAYRLGGADAALLSISKTGVVTLRNPADYEAKASYAFTVIASDGLLTTSQAVVVSVDNLNDSSPVITSGATGSVTENASTSTVIYAASATDADGPDGVSFSLGGADAALLDIDAEGQVTLKAPADYESKTSYSFSIIASDGVHETAQAVVVSVLNELPGVSSIAFTSATGAVNGTLNAGDTVQVTVSMTEATTVTGTPRLALDVGGTTVQAGYVSGSGSKSLVFSYTIQAGQTDMNGISIAADSLTLNGGTLAEAAGNADLQHGAVADNASYKIDTTAPSIAVASSAPLLHAGESATITFTFSEDPADTFSAADVQVTGGSLGELSGTGLTRSATFTAVDSANLSTGSLISVSAGAFTDAAGNASTDSAGVHIDTVFNDVLFVGNSATFGRADPVLSYNTYDAVTNPGGVHDLTSPDRGGNFSNLTGTNLYEPHDWGGVPGLVDKFAEQVGLSWDVSLSTRNAATLRGHYANTSPGGWDMRGNIASADWDIVVLQDQTDEPLPGGSGSITFAPGSATATLIVTPNGDSNNEYAETLSLSLASSAGYRVGTSAILTTTILNDDPTAPTTNPALPTVTMVASPGSVAEDGTDNLVYTFTRTGATTSDLVVTFSAFRDGSTSPSVANATTSDLELYTIATGAYSATATSGVTSPYRFASGGSPTTGSVNFASPNTGSIVIKAGQTTATFTLDPRADATVESDESVKLTLTHPSSGADYNLGTLGQVVATIVNDDFAPGTDTSLPNVTLGITSAASVYENAEQTLVYTFTRSGATTGALTVYFKEDGTATYFASDAAHSDFGISSSGATSVSLTTTSGSNADIPAFQNYATLIENYIHTGTADTTTIPGTTIPANPNASAQTDVYLYATWARPDMIAGAYDMITDKTLIASGPEAGAYTGGTISQSSTQSTAYYLTLEQMSADLTAAYANLALANPDFEGVAAVSTAFMTAVQNGVAIRDPYTEASAGSVSAGKINLWFDDNLHASKYGSYLAGLTLFQTLTGLDARVLGAADEVASDLGIDAATAIALQDVASATMGFDQSLHWMRPGAVADLGGTGAEATLATAGAYSFADPAYTAHTVTVQSHEGNLGTLMAVVRSDGNAGQVNWIYTVDNAVVDPLLDSGAQRVEQFTLTLDDGHGHTSVEVIGVTLFGTGET